MTDPQRHHREVEAKQRRRELAGIALAVLGCGTILVAVLGGLGLLWGAVLIAGTVALLGGWFIASGTDDSPGTSGTSPGGTTERDNVVEVDTDRPDAGQFIPGDPPGTFTPPPPSRDSSRDFERG